MSAGRVLSLREQLLLDVRISVCYHQRRRAFLEGFDRAAKAVGIFGGSIAFSKLLGSHDLPIALSGAAVAFFSTINLVFATGQTALRHLEIERRFIELEKKILAIKAENFTPENYETFTNEILDITAGEPTVLQSLHALCYNQVFRAAGFGEKYYLKLKWYHYPLAHVVDIKPKSIRAPFVGDTDFPTKIS